MQYFRKSGTPEPRDVSSDGDEGAARLLLDVQATLLSYPGPALIVDSRLETLSMNRRGEPISRLLSLGDEDAAGKTFRDAVREATILNMPTKTQIELVDASPERVRRFYDVSLLPCAGADKMGNDILVLARETTVDKSMLAALVRSRQLYRELLKCSSDFAWETDAEGRFEFISERGAAGYTASELNHMLSEELLDRSLCQFEPDETPFSVTFPVVNMETWVRGVDGEARCMLISAVPILDDIGHHTGTRGAGVDVTDLRRHERAVAETQRREDLVDTLLEAIRAEFEPGNMLRVAAAEIAGAMGADLGCILTMPVNGDDPMQSVWSETADEELTRLVELTASRELQASGHSPIVQNLELDERFVLLCGTLFGDEINGGLVLVRHNRVQPWKDEDRLLLRHIASQMGIILARASHAEALERLSRVDPMTHLLNRRAFYDDADLCLARNERSGKTAAYIYFDLDDFKRINDTLGHGVGDNLLIEFSDVLKTHTRKGDLAVRLGGDEFGLLLDNCDEAGAASKADEILGALGPASQNAGVPWELSVSAGIALWHPGARQSIEDVMERADRVLYEAKAAGKNGWRMAPDVTRRDDDTGTKECKE